VIKRRVGLQGQASRNLTMALSGERNTEPWQSLRYLLRLYGPELIEVVDTASAGRGRLLQELSEELPHLQERSPEELTETLKRLDSTSEKLNLATVRLAEYIRENCGPESSGRFHPVLDMYLMKR